MKKTLTKEQKTDLIICLCCIAAVLLALTVLMVVSGNRARGEIAHGELRRGNEQQFVYTGNSKLSEGDQVDWYVNNKLAGTTTYDGTKATFQYTPEREGTLFVKAVCGKYRRTTFAQVQRPLLTLTANDLTVTYGEPLPKPQFDCDGLIGDDTLQSIGLQIDCYTLVEGCGKDTIHLDAQGCENCGYDVQIVEGTCTVLPKQLAVEQIYKTYDQTNVIENPQIVLNGVLAGDEVKATCKVAYFQSKNAGVQQVTAEIVLEGKDCQNYALTGEVIGKILPKQLTLEGLTVASKTYDGTTRAQILKLGKLKGVCDGDSVAIGNLQVNFDGADIGEREIVVKQATLVGLDKDNYTLEKVCAENAEITAAK